MVASADPDDRHTRPRPICDRLWPSAVQEMPGIGKTIGAAWQDQRVRLLFWRLLAPLHLPQRVGGNRLEIVAHGHLRQVHDAGHMLTHTAALLP